MRVLSWNCRGLDNPFAVLQCQKKAKEYSPNILFLMETKLDIGKGLDVLRKCDFLNGWEVLREGLSRGLLLGWSPEQKLTIQYSSRHMIHSEILDHKSTIISSLKCAKCQIFGTFDTSNTKTDLHEMC